MQEQFSALGADRDDDVNQGSGARERGRRDSRKAALARAAMTAVEPLVELLLELGITSPEAESLLRGLFVHKSRAWLARQEGGADPSDVRAWICAYWTVEKQIVVWTKKEY